MKKKKAPAQEHFTVDDGLHPVKVARGTLSGLPFKVEYKLTYEDVDTTHNWPQGVVEWMEQAWKVTTDPHFHRRLEQLSIYLNITERATTKEEAQQAAFKAGMYFAEARALLSSYVTHRRNYIDSRPEASASRKDTTAEEYREKWEAYEAACEENREKLETRELGIVDLKKQVAKQLGCSPRTLNRAINFCASDNC